MSLHRLLVRQLGRAGVADPERPPADPAVWGDLLERVSRAYGEQESDRYLTERSMELSSRETQALNERLIDRRDKLDAVLGAVHAAVLELDASGRVTYHNEAARTLLSCELVGRSFRDLVDLLGEDGTPVPWWDQATRALGTLDGSVDVRGGRRIEVAWSTVPVGSGWVLTLTDLSEKKRALQDLSNARIDAEAARRAERERSQILTNVSHELRTPLNAIIGYAELLSEEAPAHRSDLGRILRSGRTLLSLIDNLLDLSRLESGRMELLFERVDVAEIVRDALEVVRPAAGRAGIVLEAEGPAVGPVVWADRFRLRQCLYNLAANAVKFTKRGEVRIVVSQDPEAVEIAVVDTGIGIDPHVLPRLFRPFVQAHSSTSREYGGSGLGLSLVRTLVERLGGSVHAASELGRGSTFTLRLPLALPRDG